MAKKKEAPVLDPTDLDESKINTDSVELNDSVDEREPEAPKGAKSGKPKEPEAPKGTKGTKGGKIHYDEVYCRIAGKKAEPLKIQRKGVLISKEQADTLNESVLNGPNAHGIVYLPSED